MYRQPLFLLLDSTDYPLLPKSVPKHHFVTIPSVVLRMYPFFLEHIYIMFILSFIYV